MVARVSRERVVLPPILPIHSIHLTSRRRSLFFSSADKCFILKTVNRGELATLRVSCGDVAQLPIR